MSRYRTDPESLDYEKPSACANFLHYTWKTITCLFSHITLVSMVVSYCVLGAFTFEALEVDNEKQVKRGIPRIRENVTHYLWNFTQELNALEESNFTSGAEKYLKSFENALLDAMTKDGWDGIEDEHKVQWTFTGSLFYSIIVITTIGYGHIAPKTTWGKVVTIFYAILGIPLMLLCLSNIGDIMATSFRFIYWRVCCYVCTKKPKKMKRTKSVRSAVRSELTRSRNASVRRSVRTSTKSTDSGLAFSDIGPASHSDTELRYEENPHRTVSVSRTRYNKFQKTPGHAVPRKISQNSYQSNHSTPNHISHQRGYSLDRKRQPREVDIELDPMGLDKSAILCNKYVVGRNEGFSGKIPGKGLNSRQSDVQNRASSMPAQRRDRSMTRTSNYLEPPRISSPEEEEEEELEIRGIRRGKSPMRRQKLPNRQSPSPRMMTPLGYAHKSKYLDDSDSDQDYDYYEDSYEPGRPRIKPVPIWLCVCLVVGYILAGAYLFKSWENWEYLDAAYFCFITLTTIGFGDLVPAKGVSQDGYYATISIALCSLYLLFGISLLAMSFNLVQEEVISNVKSVAKTLGIIKSDSDDEDEYD